MYTQIEAAINASTSLIQVPILPCRAFISRRVVTASAQIWVLGYEPRTLAVHKRFLSRLVTCDRNLDMLGVGSDEPDAPNRARSPHSDPAGHVYPHHNCHNLSPQGL